MLWHILPSLFCGMSYNFTQIRFNHICTNHYAITRAKSDLWRFGSRNKEQVQRTIIVASTFWSSIQATPNSRIRFVSSQIRALLPSLLSQQVHDILKSIRARTHLIKLMYLLHEDQIPTKFPNPVYDEMVPPLTASWFLNQSFTSDTLSKA